MNSDDLGSRVSASTIAASYPTTHTSSCDVLSVSCTLHHTIRALHGRPRRVDRERVGVDDL